MSSPNRASPSAVDRAAATLLASLNRSGAVDRMRKAIESRVAASDAARLSQVQSAAAAFLRSSTERNPAALLQQTKAAVLTPALRESLRADVANAAKGEWVSEMVRKEVKGLDALCEAAKAVDAGYRKRDVLKEKQKPEAESRERFLQKIIGSTGVRKPPVGKNVKRCSPSSGKSVSAKGKDGGRDARDPKEGKRPRSREGLPPLAKNAAAKETHADAASRASPRPEATRPAAEKDAPASAAPRRRSRSREPGGSSDELLPPGSRDTKSRGKASRDPSVNKGKTCALSALVGKGAKDRNSDSSEMVTVGITDGQVESSDKRNVTDTTPGRRSGFAEMAAVLRKLETSRENFNEPVSSDKTESESKVLDGTVETDLDGDVRASNKLIEVSPKADKAAGEAKTVDQQGQSVKRVGNIEAKERPKPSPDPKSATIEYPKRAKQSSRSSEQEAPASSTVASGKKKQRRDEVGDNTCGYEKPSSVEESAETVDTNRPDNNDKAVVLHQDTVGAAVGKSEQLLCDDHSYVETADSHSFESERAHSGREFAAGGGVKRVLRIRRASPKQVVAATARHSRGPAGGAGKRKQQDFAGPKTSTGTGAVKTKLRETDVCEDLSEAMRKPSKARLRSADLEDSVVVLGEAMKVERPVRHRSSKKGVSHPNEIAGQEGGKVRDKDSAALAKSKSRPRQSQDHETREVGSSKHENRSCSPDFYLDIPTGKKAMKSTDKRKGTTVQGKEKKRSRQKERIDISTEDHNHENGIRGASDLSSGPKPASAKRRRVDRSVDAVCVPEDFEQQQKILLALKELMETEYAEPFLEPVDPYDEGCKTYYEEITNPIDLGTISKRLKQATSKRGYYANSKAVMSDIELVWSNCRQFNGIYDPICDDLEKCSMLLSALFEKYGVDCVKDCKSNRRRSRGKSLKRTYDEKFTEEMNTTSQPRKKAKSNDANDGRLVGKTVTVFVPQGPKKVKTWMEVQVTDFLERSKTYTLQWLDSGKKTSNATFGVNKMYPVFRQ